LYPGSILSALAFKAAQSSAPDGQRRPSSDILLEEIVDPQIPARHDVGEVEDAALASHLKRLVATVDGDRLLVRIEDQDGPGSGFEPELGVLLGGGGGDRRGEDLGDKTFDLVLSSSIQQGWTSGRSSSPAARPRMASTPLI